MPGVSLPPRVVDLEARLERARRRAHLRQDLLQLAVEALAGIRLQRSLHLLPAGRVGPPASPALPPRPRPSRGRRSGTASCPGTPPCLRGPPARRRRRSPAHCRVKRACARAGLLALPDERLGNRHGAQYGRGRPRRSRATTPARLSASSSLCGASHSGANTEASACPLPDALHRCANVEALDVARHPRLHRHAQAFVELDRAHRVERRGDGRRFLTVGGADAQVLLNRRADPSRRRRSACVGIDRLPAACP